MTDIRFHVYVVDRVAYGARLVRKSLSVGTRLCVLADERDRLALSRHLWAMRPADFVPHALAGLSAAETIVRSPVVIGSTSADVLHHDALLNLLPEVPLGFERFDRLIEVVGTDEAEVVAGRARWRHYRARGYPLAKHEVTA
jgi:DNA polymerase III subunit chi